MGNKSALGKGLNALLPEDRDDAVPDESRESADDSEGSGSLYQFEDGTQLLGRVARVPLDRIRPNPYQPRQEFDEERLDELASSIAQIGIIQPVTVRAQADGEFEIISGERRVRAARRADLDHLPAFVREADSEEMLEMALVENVQREELNPIEIALGYQRLVEECDFTQAEVAERVSKSRATVSNFLRLLQLPPRIQAGLRDKELSMGHARALITIDDEEAQLELYEQIVEEDLSVREVEERVRTWQEDDEEESTREAETEKSMAPSPTRGDLQLDDLRDRLRSRFSTQVKITHNKDGEGTIEISYYSEEDLERLVEDMVGG